MDISVRLCVAAQPFEPVGSDMKNTCRFRGLSTVYPLLKTAAPFSHLGGEGAEAGAGAMLVACQLVGLSVLGAYYAGVRARAQCRPTRSPNAASPPRPPAWLSTGAPSASRRYGRSSEKRVSEPISLDEFGPSSITGIIPSPAFDIGWPIPEFLYASHGWSSLFAASRRAWRSVCDRYLRNEVASSATTRAPATDHEPTQQERIRLAVSSAPKRTHGGTSAQSPMHTFQY